MTRTRHSARLVAAIAATGLLAAACGEDDHVDDPEITSAADPDADPDGDGLAGAAATVREVCLGLLNAYGTVDDDGTTQLAAQSVLDDLREYDLNGLVDEDVFDGDLECGYALGDGSLVLTIEGNEFDGYRATDSRYELDREITVIDGESEEVYDVSGEVEGRLKNGELCEDAIEVDGTIEVFDTSTGVIAIVTCEVFAYQSAFDLLYVDGDGSLPLQAYAWNGEEPEPVNDFVGYVQPFEDGGFEVITLARGVGDCGEVITFADAGVGTFPIVDVRARDCAESQEDGPDDWPVVWTAGE